jgi:malonate decarboxylase gamma subunit
MDAQSLLSRLFPDGFEIQADGLFFSGKGTTRGMEVAVIGSIDAAAIGIELAFQMAGAVLDIVRLEPERPILLLVDTTGQRLTRRDELLGINAYMAHLAKCLELARNQGHKIIGLVYSQAVSGGFLASSLLSDRCYALPEAEVRVMNLPAMARITKIPLERLEQLSQSSPVFAPGVENYRKMGAIADIWQGDLAACLIDALAQDSKDDNRRRLGAERQGRTLAEKVAERVRRGAR